MTASPITHSFILMALTLQTQPCYSRDPAHEVGGGGKFNTEENHNLSLWSDRGLKPHCNLIVYLV